MPISCVAFGCTNKQKSQGKKEQNQVAARRAQRMMKFQHRSKISHFTGTISAFDVNKSSARLGLKTVFTPRRAVGYTENILELTCSGRWLRTSNWGIIRS